MLRSLLLALLLACPPLADSQQADAARDSARDLALVAAPFKGWRLGKFRLEGLPKQLARPLRHGLALQGRPRLGGLLGHVPLVLTPALLAEDADRILLFLATNGHPWAHLSARATPLPRRRVKLILSVDPGPAVRIGTLSLELPAGPHPGARESRLRELLPQPGQVFRDVDFLAGSRKVEDLLRAGGHARASCGGLIQREDSLHLGLVYQARPGPVFLVDSVIVTGVKPDLNRLAQRSLGPLRGRPCTPRLLAEAQDRLSLLGVYRQIRFLLADPSAGSRDSTTLDLRAELAPRPPHGLEAGVGWLTGEGGRVNGRWSHANLFLGGRGLQASGSLSRVKQTGRLESWWPTLGLPTLRGEVSLTLDRQRELSYRLLSRELRLGARVQPSLLIALNGGVAVSEVLVDMLSADSTALLAEPGRQTIFNAAVLRNATDNPLDPTQGTLASLQAEWTIPGFFSNADYLRLDAARSAYRRMGVVIGAARLRLGLAWPLGSSQDLLPNKRFFAGGVDQRGFARHRLGPRDDTGAALGGQALVLGSLELRVPLVWRFAGAVFLDAGQVYASPGEMRADELELAAGPALLLKTPVGPLRCDVGWRLGAASDQLGRWALHVSIGHPY